MTGRRRLGIALLGAALLVGTARAEEAPASPEAAFQAGAQAYREGDFDVAARAWTGVLDSGVVNGHVYYNLGNALYRQERVGGAILAWRRAGLLLPRDPDVSANLDRARLQVRDRLEPPEVVPPWLFWQHPLALHESIVLAAGLLGLALALEVGLRVRAVAASGVRVAAGTLAVVGLLLGLSTVLVAREVAQAPVAVVLADEVRGRSTPGAGGVELFALHEGAEVRVRETLDGAVQVELPDGRRGWLASTAVGLVRPEDPFPLP